MAGPAVHPRRAHVMTASMVGAPGGQRAGAERATPRGPVPDARPLSGGCAGGVPAPEPAVHLAVAVGLGERHDGSAGQQPRAGRPGRIGFSLFLRIGGGSLFAFTLLSARRADPALVTYVGTYPLLKPATFLLPALAYFFAVRSYRDLPGRARASGARRRRTHAIRRLRPAAHAAPLAGPARRDGRLAIAGLGAGSPWRSASTRWLLGRRWRCRIISTPARRRREPRAEGHRSASPTTRDRRYRRPSRWRLASGVTSFWSIRTGPQSLAPGATRPPTPCYSPNTPSQPVDERRS